MSALVIRKSDFQNLLFNAINPSRLNRSNKLGIAVNHKPESLALVGLLRDCLPSDHLHAISIDLKINDQISRQILQISDKVSNLGVNINSLDCDCKVPQFVLGSKLDQQKSSRKLSKYRIDSMLMQECKNNNISILAFGDTLEDYLVALLKEISSEKVGYVHGLDVLGSLSVGGDRVMALRPLLKYNMVCKFY